MIRSLLTFLPLFFLSQQVWAAYDVNETCKRVWMLVMDLQIGQAKQLLAQEIKRNPENYYAYYLDQTCDVFRLLINSSDDEYDTFVENFYKRREIMDGKDEDSPYYLSCAAEMDLHVAVFSIMHGSQWNGLTKGYAAYKKVYRNLEKFPSFQPNHKLDGFFNVGISNLPPFVKWAVSFFGVKVNLDYGFRVLHDYYLSQKNTEGLNAEAALFIIFAAKINKTPEKVYVFTKSLDSQVTRTFIHSYFRANIAYCTGRNEEALATLDGIRHDPGDGTEVLYNYMKGKALLRKQDPQAGLYLTGYLTNLKKKEYVKEINYALALHYLLLGNRRKYTEYCDIVKKQGMDMNERDREALYDANLDYPPDVNLVKARLSLDGGYTEAYVAAMRAFESGPCKGIPCELESHFFKGRYEAARKNDITAIAEFMKVIDLGEDQDYYFASEAAWRLGNIYRETGKKELAEECYRKSLKLYRNNYYEYIEDKANKAINSL